MKRPIARRPILWASIVLVILGAMTGLILAQRSQAASAALPVGQATPEASPTPITLPFSHRVHVQEAEVPCLFCHSGAARAPQATIPSLQKCMVCHEYITLDEPEAEQQVAQLKEAFQQGARVQWPDVYKQPDYVYFSHRPHVAKDISCETCHGDVPNMDLVEKQVEMNMGFCLNCHRQQPAEEVPRLLDCITCHK